MDYTYWQKQTPNAPLFPDILWSRPEHTGAAGKLLVVGGNSFGFAAPGTAYAEAEKARAGAVRVLLPQSLQKTVGQMLPSTEFAPNNQSGSFAAQALAPLTALAAWADATLLAGDFGRNSETAVLLEKFAARSAGLLAVTQDAADYFLKAPLTLLRRPHTALFISYEQLQKYASSAHFSRALLFSFNIVQTVEWLHEFTLLFGVLVVTLHSGQYFVAFAGNVVTHPEPDGQKIWRVATAARGSVFWLQNPAKPLEAVASSLLVEN